MTKLPFIKATLGIIMLSRFVVISKSLMIKFCSLFCNSNNEFLNVKFGITDRKIYRKKI